MVLLLVGRCNVQGVPSVDQLNVLRSCGYRASDELALNSSGKVSGYLYDTHFNTLPKDRCKNLQIKL